MKSTDLKDPGDFHQITHQIRELVAYAISQLEIAEADGSLPSGKFAAFLHDAAVQCPGFVADGGAQLGPNQTVVEDGDVIMVKGAEVSLAVTDSVIVSATLVSGSYAVVRHADRMQIMYGDNGAWGQVDISNNSVFAVMGPTNAAMIADGQRLPMHDLGGAGGDITAKVVNGLVTDMVFSTPDAKIVRPYQRFPLGTTGTFVTSFYQSDNSLEFRITDNAYAVAKLNSDIRWGVTGPVVGTFAKVDGNRLQLAPISFYGVTDARASFPVRNYPSSTQVASGTHIKLDTGLLSTLRLDGDCFAIKNGEVFTVGSTSYRPTIANGLVSKLESAS